MLIENNVGSTEILLNHKFKKLLKQSFHDLRPIGVTMNRLCFTKVIVCLLNDIYDKEDLLICQLEPTAII